MNLAWPCWPPAKATWTTRWTEVAAVAGTAEGQAVMDALLEFVAREAADAISEIDTTLDTRYEPRSAQVAERYDPTILC